jgi:hypothetical protein
MAKTCPLPPTREQKLPTLLPETKHIHTGNIRLCYSHWYPCYASKMPIQVVKMIKNKEI